MASKLGLASLEIALTLETRLVEAVTLATCARVLLCDADELERVPR